MTNWLITMGGARYDATTKDLVERGPELGADRVLVYDDVWVRAHGFYRANRWLWEHPGQRFPNGTYGRRGFGWYAWKALLMLDALDHYAQPGDVVLYVDGDSRPVANFSCIYEIARRDGAMFFASQGHKQRSWCTNDCYLAMGLGCDSDKALAAERLAGREGTPEAIVRRYYDAPAGVARFFAVHKGPWLPRQLLMEWLAYAVNPMTTTFDPSELASKSHPDWPDDWREHHGFEEHRTEQAIMTNLCLKHGFKLWREADDSGEGWADDRDVYGQLFEQVRMGDGSAAGGSRFCNVPMPEGT